ncbi:MAG: algJ [Planctomycetota bacterium]|nr:algJ [Planctomycetota bacterium]
MRSRRERLARVVVALIWVGGLTLALRLGLAAADPAEVLGLLVAVYLGLWGLVFFLKPGLTTTNAARFVLCSLAICLGILAAELPAAMKILDYRDIFQTPTSAWRRHDHRPDPDLIYVRDGHRRNRGRFVGGELHRLQGAKPWSVYSIDTNLDRNGFRNPRDLQSADLVVVGDSFVEGLHVADHELMTTYLADSTHQVIANLGRSGDGPQQERIILERFGLPLRPKTCVWLFYEGNDLEDVTEYEANRRVIPMLKTPTAARVLVERSFLRNALMFARRRWLSPEVRWPAARYAGTFPSREHGSLPLYFASDDHHRANSLGDPSRLARATASLAEAHELCRRHGVRLVVVFVPTKWRVYGGLCEFSTDSPCPSWTLDDQPDRIRAAVRGIAPEIGFLDLTTRFRAEATRGDLLYLPDDTHWTAAGHASAARAIAELLEP